MNPRGIVHSANAVHVGPGSPTGANQGNNKSHATSAAECAQVIKSWPCLSLYSAKPDQTLALFDLETIVMQRMELLAFIDALRNSPVINSSSELTERVAHALRGENMEQVGLNDGKKRHATTNPIPKELLKGERFDEGHGGIDFSFTPGDDNLAHLCCRLVFCQSTQWREWFIRNEELIFRARVKKLIDSNAGYRRQLFEAVDLPVQDVPEGFLTPVQTKWLTERHSIARATGAAGAPTAARQFCLVPLSHAGKAVWARSCICVKGRAVVPLESVVEAYFAEFRRVVARGLNDAHFIRQRILGGTSTDAASGGSLTNTMAMLDAFFARFIVDPTDQAKPVSAGAVTAQDIPRLAEVHFPLCMKRTDDHLRKERHLKHHGRWAFGLFLKGIGLSMEESLSLFGSLLTLKASKDFLKSSYAYNIRHAFGKEGKRTSYTSLTCASIVAQPPNVDRFDCHGCPYRFKDEGQLRGLLAQPRKAPDGSTVPRLNPSDIEDIVQDAKDMHYTRACFKQFVASHKGAKIQRDSLFRSPLEYYLTSVSAWEAAGKDVPSTAADEQTPQGKRTRESEGPISVERTRFQPKAEQP
jgi:DNA primase large subunit